jgi:TPR repeat protein
MDPPQEIPDLEIVNLLTVLAESGDLDSQQNLFLLYSDEKNLDIDKLLYWADKIIVHDEIKIEGIVNTYDRIGDTYIRQQNFKKALYYYYTLMGIIKDNYSKNLVSFFHFLHVKIARTEFSLKENIKQALNYCSQIINLPDVDCFTKAQARTELASYLINKGGNENMKMALIYYTDALSDFEKSQKTPDAWIYNNMGYINECLGDFLKAAEYYSMSSQMGDEFAACNLGNLYEKGLGVEKNDALAQKFFEKGEKRREAWKKAREPKEEKISHSLDELFKQIFTKEIKKRKIGPPIEQNQAKKQRTLELNKNDELLEKLKLIEAELAFAMPFSWEEVYSILERALSSSDEQICSKGLKLWSLYTKALDQILGFNAMKALPDNIIKMSYFALIKAKHSPNEHIKDNATWLLKKYNKLFHEHHFDTTCFYCCYDFKDCSCLDQSIFLNNIGMNCFVCLLGENECRCDQVILNKLTRALFRE